MNLIPDIYSNRQPPQELYFITPIDNVPSILENGILSHKRVNRLAHQDISNAGVQENRAHKMVPNLARQNAEKKALRVHQHANLYLRAYNSMMYVKRELRDSVCVLRIDPRILLRDEVVISNMNAAKNNVRFENAETFKFSPESAEMQLERLSYVFSDKKTGKTEKRKAVHQAEVLVPYELHPSYVRGIYIANDIARQALTNQFPNGISVPIDLHPSLFFSGENAVKAPGGYNPLLTITPQPLSNADYPELVEEYPESSDDEQPRNSTPPLRSSTQFDLDDVIDD